MSTHTSGALRAPRRASRRSQILDNSVTGDRVAIDEHAERFSGACHARVVFAAGGPEVPTHVHPHQDERYVVVGGALTVQVDGTTRRVSSGQTLEIPRGTPHAIWNGEAEDALVVWEARPALRTAELAQRLFALATDEGRPGGWPRRALALSVVLDEFVDEIRLVRRVSIWERLGARLLAPFARRLGFGHAARAVRALDEVGHQLDLTADTRSPSGRRR